MSEQPRIVTGLGKAELHRILIRGYDLNEELLGKITFADMAALMLMGRMPSDGERRVIDALLVVLVEHGMVSSVIAARLTYHTAPESIQAAVAASLMGAGTVHLGSSDWCAQILQEAVPLGTQPGDLDQLAEEVAERYRRMKKRVPGIGHRTHAEGDPRAVRLFEIAREGGVYGTYCELLQRISLASGQKVGRPLPPNVTGAIAAIACDLGLPWQMAKAFALVGRTLGSMAHIGEEIRNPMAGPIQAAIKNAIVYEVDGRQ